MIILGEPTPYTVICDICGVVIEDSQTPVRLRVSQRGYDDEYKDLHRDCCGVMVSELLQKDKEEL